jgi:lipid A ethanolaminephosphotransferase
MVGGFGRHGTTGGLQASFSFGGPNHAMSALADTPREPVRAPLFSRRFTLVASGDHVLLGVSLFWVLTANRPFFDQALAGRSPGDPSAWGFALALGVALVSLHFLVLATVAHRRILKPLVALLILGAALATHFIERFGVYLDASMLRNVLHTDPAEAAELLSGPLVMHLLLHAALPLALLWQVRLVERPWRRAVGTRVAALLVSALVLVGSLLAVFPSFSSLMRNHTQLRYLITPANTWWSLVSVLMQDARGAAAPRQAIGLDARPGASWALGGKPRVIVLVIGETARAANWGLNGYARQTTPELAARPVINFMQVSSCGTNTEVSLPCMFAPVGRRDYDEARVRNSESLLHVAARAGVAVHWRDNQSGCKGVCDGLPNDSVQRLDPPGLCAGAHCLDEGLLYGLDDRLAKAQGTQLWVLHQLGNHGPSYFRRYPPAFARFRPACASDDLHQCTQQEIVNTYDNALLYTDHLLGRVIDSLQAAAGRVDSALIYVSDHGESLGENNLYLHGMPFAIAPEVQTRVPMTMWLSAGHAQARAVDADCLKQRAARPASHDHLFHTVLGLLDVSTRLYEPELDLVRGCRASSDHSAAARS